MISPPNNQAVGNLKDDVEVFGVDQLSRGADFIPSPTKKMKSLCDTPYNPGSRINLAAEDIEDEVFNDEENKIFDSVLDDASLLYDILEAVKAKSSKRVTENEFTMLFDLQEKIIHAFSEIKEKYLFMKLGYSERKNTTEVNPILVEMKKINEHLTVVEGSLGKMIHVLHQFFNHLKLNQLGFQGERSLLFPLSLTQTFQELNLLKFMVLNLLEILSLLKIF